MCSDSPRTQRGQRVAATSVSKGRCDYPPRGGGGGGGREEEEEREEHYFLPDSDEKKNLHKSYVDFVF